MREVPYETDHDVRARSRRDRMYERINDFLARGGRGRSGRGGRGRGMMNRIGYRTYDNYEGDEHRSYEDIEVADVYVAINAQYHDYCKLFEKWFGKGNFDDMIFESAIDFWFDDVDFGEDKLWKYFNELK